MALDKKPGQKAYCAGMTAAGSEDYCPQHQPQMPPAADYAGLDFKELLAACPLEGIDLARPRDASF